MKDSESLLNLLESTIEFIEKDLVEDEGGYLGSKAKMATHESYLYRNDYKEMRFIDDFDKGYYGGFMHGHNYALNNLIKHVKDTVLKRCVVKYEHPTE